MSRELGPSPRRILEVGAGDGALALELVAAGHDVVALDASPDAVRRTRARGVRTERADWPDYDGGPFDVVLFVRSLHHVADLGAAVEKARQVLEPAGQVLVEDFGFHEVSPGTVRWFRDRLQELESRARGSISHSNGFAARIFGAEDPIQAWHLEADHIHSGDVIRNRLAGSFVLEREAEAPYLYRYVDGLVSAEEVEAFFQTEVEAMDTDSISPLGRRFVGRRRE